MSSSIKVMTATAIIIVDKITWNTWMNLATPHAEVRIEEDVG